MRWKCANVPYERLKGGGLFDVRREIIDKVLREAEDSPGYPMAHFIPKSEIGRDPATVYAGPAPLGSCKFAG